MEDCLRHPEDYEDNPVIELLLEKISKNVHLIALNKFICYNKYMIWKICNTKKERREKVKVLLLTNDKAVLRAIIAIYNRQTEDEKTQDSTKHENYIGFCANDAPIMSLYAKQIQQYGGLTKEQLVIARKRISRYTRQLADLADLYEHKLRLLENGTKC